MILYSSVFGVKLGHHGSISQIKLAESLSKWQEHYIKG